jgi:hypothetical protein
MQAFDKRAELVEARKTKTAEKKKAKSDKQGGTKSGRVK